VAAIELLWAMGSAARTSLPPPLIPITIQRFPYLAPLGLTIADALESLNLIALEGDCVVLGGLAAGRPTARLNRGLGWSMGALHLVRARKAPGAPGPCLRCGSCRAACPLDLRIDLLAAFEVERWPGLAARMGETLLGCLRCGACALACPSSRPLMALALMAGPGQKPPSFSLLSREAYA
jgi:Na+-translocating ferredoxin:NAD+ oxidoreductase RnfC subunit